MFGGFPRECLSLCCLQASSAAAEHLVSDEGMPMFFMGTTGRGGTFFGYFLCCCRQRKCLARGCEYPQPTTVQNWKKLKHGFRLQTCRNDALKGKNLDYSGRPALHPSGRIITKLTRDIPKSKPLS